MMQEFILGDNKGIMVTTGSRFLGQANVQNTRVIVPRQLGRQNINTDDCPRQCAIWKPWNKTIYQLHQLQRMH